MDQHTDTGEPADYLQVAELATLRVVSDALRARIIDVLRAAPHTAKELAEALRLSPKQLYYHLNLLERHGLIRVVRTRVVSGIIEKQYRATAYLFLFDNDVFAAPAPADDASLPPGLGILFDSTRNQLAQAYEAGVRDDRALPAHERLLMAWTGTELSGEQAEAFYTRVAALLDEFHQTPAPLRRPGAVSYRLFLTLFPLRPTPPRGDASGAAADHEGAADA